MSYPTGLAAMPDNGGAFSQASINQINTNSQATISTGGGQTIAGALTVSGLLTAGSASIPGVTTPAVQTAAGTTDAVTFVQPINICIFTSTGPDGATLATPGAGDVGKILILVNTNTTQNVVTTAANKIVNGTGTAGDTLTAPAHAGAVAFLVASNGFWNLVVGGTGSWVLSEV